MMISRYQISGSLSRRVAGAVSDHALSYTRLIAMMAGLTKWIYVSTWAQTRLKAKCTWESATATTIVAAARPSKELVDRNTNLSRRRCWASSGQAAHTARSTGFIPRPSFLRMRGSNPSTIFVSVVHPHLNATVQSGWIWSRKFQEILRCSLHFRARLSRPQGSCRQEGQYPKGQFLGIGQDECRSSDRLRIQLPVILNLVAPNCRTGCRNGFSADRVHGIDRPCVPLPTPAWVEIVHKRRPVRMGLVH
jgi:hypothetical protein